MQNKDAGKFSDFLENKSKKKNPESGKSSKRGAEYNSYPDISDTASATECTGLMYAPPLSEDEYDSYQELSSMSLPKKK